MNALAQHLDIIAAMSLDFAQNGDIEATLRKGLGTIAETVGAEAASLFLVDEETGELVCTACHGPVDITGLRLPPGTGIVGCAVSQDRTQLVRDVRADPNFREAVDASTGFVTRSLLCAPMTVRDKRLGAIELLNKKDGGLFATSDRNLLQALAASAALALFNARLAAAMVEQERIRRELELAAQIQRSMLPDLRSPDLPLWGINLPARTVSGDFYDVVGLGDGRFAFCVGDVSGKGINAALLMAKAASLFRCLARSHDSPGRLLSAMNDELCQNDLGGMFVTMAAGVVDIRRGEVVLASAGHEPAVLNGPQGRLSLVYAEAPPLGIGPDFIDDAVPETRLSLDGSSLYLFTDGLTEIQDAKGGLLGSDAARRIIAECAGLPAPERLKAIVDRAVSHGAAQRDDIALLLVEGPSP